MNLRPEDLVPLGVLIAFALKFGPGLALQGFRNVQKNISQVLEGVNDVKVAAKWLVENAPIAEKAIVQGLLDLRCMVSPQVEAAYTYLSGLPVHVRVDIAEKIGEIASLSLRMPRKTGLGEKVKRMTALQKTIVKTKHGYQRVPDHLVSIGEDGKPRIRGEGRPPLNSIENITLRTPKGELIWVQDIWNKERELIELAQSISRDIGWLMIAFDLELDWIGKEPGEILEALDTYIRVLRATGPTT